MTKRSSNPVLLLCAALGIACGSETTLEPQRPRVFTRLEVAPTFAELLVFAPGNQVQLSIAAWDQTGEPMQGADAATYSSSHSAIAGVSSSGVVTAAAPGTAVITATLTLGGITRTDSMTVTVYDGAVEYPEIAGVYDLTALITSSDPAWGIEDGTRQTAVLMIQHSPNTTRIQGTFTDFRAISPSGDTLWGNPGVVDGNAGPDARVVIELFFAGSQSSYWYGEGMQASGKIEGRFGAGGHISGTFTLERRHAE